MVCVCHVSSSLWIYFVAFCKRAFISSPEPWLIPCSKRPDPALTRNQDHLGPDLDQDHREQSQGLLEPDPGRQVEDPGLQAEGPGHLGQDPDLQDSDPDLQGLDLEPGHQDQELDQGRFI